MTEGQEVSLDSLPVNVLTGEIAAMPTINHMRQMVRGYDDAQKVRIMCGNRLVASFRRKLGIESSQPETDLEKEDKKLMDTLRLSYKNITDGVVNKMPTYKKFKAEGVIDKYSELSLMNLYFTMEDNEVSLLRTIQNSLADYPIWTEYLQNIKGVGPTSAAWLISEIDIHKCRYPSSMHKYAGYDVVARHGEMVNGEWVEYSEPRYEGRSKKKEHLMLVKYQAKDGTIQEKNSITFNDRLKTHLYILGTSFIKCASPYSKIYYDYKTRYTNMDRHKEKTKMHIHMMCMRQMLKHFLTDLYRAWRELEGLEVFDTYLEAKLGHIHSAELKGQDFEELGRRGLQYFEGCRIN